MTIAALSNSSVNRSAPPQVRDAAEAFKRLDTGNKGYLTQADVESAVVNISPGGASQSTQAAAADAKKAFEQMDGDNDGQVTEAEFKQAAAEAGPPAGAQGKGPPGAAGPKGAPPAAAAAASSASYEAADANTDGKVTQQEQSDYDAEHPKATAESGKANLAASAAVKTYEAVAAVGAEQEG